MSTREVTLEGGSPWGFRMHGGIDVNQPLRISRVNPGSKACLKGVREGDLITSINNATTKEISNSEAHRLLRSAGNRLILGLNEDSRRPSKRRQYKSILHQHQQVVEECSKTSTTSTSHTTLITNSSNTESSSSREEMEDEGGTQDTHTRLPNTSSESNKDAQLHPATRHLKNCIFGKSNESLVKQALVTPSSDSCSDEALRKDEEGHVEVDETPCVSTVSPTPTATPSSSHYSSDTKAETDSMPQQHQRRAKRNRRRGPKKAECVEDTRPDPEQNAANIRMESAAPVMTSKSTESVAIGECGNVETLKITELKSGDELSDDDLQLTCKLAIISEADDDVNWERTGTLGPQDLSGNLNPQEEAQLRYFIEKLNLGESSNLNATSSAIRQKRGVQRQQMMQVLAPIFDNPRFLHAISEEPSESFDPKPQRTDCVVVQIQKVIEKGEAEVVVLDSCSSDETCSSTSGSVELEALEGNAQGTPPPSPEKEETSLPEESEEDIDLILANVGEKIEKIEKNIKMDQKLIDDLQISLGEDHKEIKKAQEELTHNKKFEKDFQEFIQGKLRRSEEKESSDSSNSSLGSTIVFNDSLEAELENLVESSPRSLKEHCLNRLIELPFGKEALEELADISESLSGLTETLPSIAYQMMSCPYNTAREEKFEDETVSREVSEIHDYDANQEVKMDDEEITSTSTTKDRTCLSENTSTIREEVVTKSVIDISGSRKLLDILIKEKLAETKVDVGPERTKEEIQQLNDARLNARDMSEWLKLVRGTRKLPYTHSESSPPPADTNWDTGPKDANNHSVPDRPPRRRRSLPPEVHTRQMQYLIEKEKLVQLELERLEGERRKLSRMIDNEKRLKVRPSSLPPDEDLRQKMYEEYQQQLAQREERKHHKVIKISMKDHAGNSKENKEFNEIEREFMSIVKEKKRKVKESDLQRASRESSTEKSEAEGSGTVLILDGTDLCAKKIPRHLQEFIALSNLQDNQDHDADTRGDGIWSPGQKSSFDREELQRESTQLTSQGSIRSEEDCPTAVWTPKSAATSPIAERREFRPVAFESPVPARRNRTKSECSAQAEPPWKSDKHPTSQSSPGPGFTGNSEFSSRLPKVHNPTITLLQKARETHEQERFHRKKESPYNSQSDLIYQLRTESISDSDSERPKITRPLKHFEGTGSTSHGVPFCLRSEIRNANMSQWYKKMYDTIHKARPNKYDEEEFVTVRYKQRNRDRYPFTTGYLSEPEPGAYDSDSHLDSRFATLDRRRVPWHTTSNSNISNHHPVHHSRFETLATQSSTLPTTKPSKETSKDSPSFSGLRQAPTQRPETTITYKPEKQQPQSAIQHRPGKIENYMPGKSSITEHQAKQWWDEVMDIFDGWLDNHTNIFPPSYQQTHDNLRSYRLLDRFIARQAMEKQQKQPKVPLVEPKGYLSQTLRQNGYDSDSTLVFHRKEEIAPHISPTEQREAYKSIQKGGDVPLHGLRKAIPDRPKDEAEYLEYCASIKKKQGPRSDSSRRSRSNSENKECRYEVLCYPVHHEITRSPETFAMYKRSAPSSSERSRKPPSPPRRKSSRNNTTLRMIHSGKFARDDPRVVDKRSVSKRHESCFSAISRRSQTDHVKRIREKITSKLLQNQEPKRKITSKRQAVIQKCYCTKSKPCSKCSNPEKIFSSNRNGNQLLKSSIGIKKDLEISKGASLTKSPSIALKKSLTRESRTSVKRNSKATVNPDESTQKIMKKTKIKKEIINNQTKTEQKSSRNYSTFAKNKIMSTDPCKAKPSGFFEQLFFGRNKTPENPAKNDIPPRPSFEITEPRCDPTLRALKLYLSHIKPVTGSKFKYLDMIRSRSSSPKGMLPGRYDDSRERSISLPPKLIFTQTSRPVTPIIERKMLTVFQPSAKIVGPKIEKLYFTQTSRPVSPMVVRRDKTRTPGSFTSQTSNLSSPCPSPCDMLYFSETSRPVSPVVVQQPPQRPISPIYNPPCSPNAIRSPSYRRIKHKHVEPRRSQKFQDLNIFYQDLKRRASFNDIQQPRKFEDDIVDYESWPVLSRQSQKTQQDHDILFKSRKVNKWRRDLDRGLRIKEKSVENLRKEFEQIRKDQLEREKKIKEDLRNSRGVYKTTWRGHSVVNLAHILNESERSKSESRVESVRQRILDNEELLNYGVGSRIWSSLSLEQVNILKNQLTQIYGNDERFKKPATIVRSPRKPPDYSILVDPKRTKPPKELRVRRNSDSSDSNSNTNPVPRWRSDVEARKMLSEEEKRKLSQSLSREVLERKSSTAVIRAKETRGAVAVADAKLPEKTKANNLHPCPPAVRSNCVSIPGTDQAKSDTESGMENSTNTVVFNEPRGNYENNRSPQKTEKILSKVEYFENKQKEVFTPTIYKASEEPVDASQDTINVAFVLPRSQSNQDLRELYGETNLKRFATEPLSASRKTKYVMPSSPQLRSSYSRCRSLSPDAKNGFSPIGNLKDGQKFITHPRRYSSDPELNKYSHNGGKVSELKLTFEYPNIAGRGRSRVRKSGLVRSPYLKAEDRYMPHINIISKIASLYPRASKKEATRSSEDLAKILGIPVGEVTKMRERFDTCDKNMSILGHMFTSSPNINELRDVAQYLTGNWYAHKYPKAEGTDLVPKQLNPRPKSASPTRPKNRLASILKVPKCHRKKSLNEPEGPPPPPPSVENEQERVEEQFQNNDASTEAAKKYVENEVNIHYRMPVRQEVKEIIDEQELARRQADAMRKIYEEERQRKHLQVSHSDNELQDRKSRRHTDNFMPSEKSPIPLNRYDDFIEEMSTRQQQGVRSPEPRLVARALFNFVGQSARELTFRKGDLIFIRRQVDKNWYEGEINAMVGLFPANYVAIAPYDGSRSTPRKAHEGQARAKYNFIAQSHLELSLAKGELVVIIRRVDDNWFEGRIGGRKGIFPVSYVEVLIDAAQESTTPVSTKPVASPAAHSMLLNGTSSGKESMGAHNYLPTFPTQDLGMSYRAKPIQVTSAGTYGSLKKNPIDQALHIDIHNEPISYRALYKYKPQNEDELELLEGDVIQVLEKCDDGWYVGTSERTGAFGTFPGNYVDRIVN